MGVVCVFKKSVRYLYAFLRWVLSDCIWSCVRLRDISSVVLCLVRFGCGVCSLLFGLSGGRSGTAVTLLKFRKFKNFVTKFGSFGDSKKRDLSIW